MNALRRGLGRYVAREKPLPPGGLTLHDTAELIRRAGISAGFVVESEYKCVQGPGGHRRKIDWVWFAKEDREHPVVAIEIEGPDVYQKSLDADCEKFCAFRATLCVLVLFQVDHDLTSKRSPPHPVERARRLLKLPRVEVHLDADLMSSGGIEQLQQRAKQAVARRCSKA